MRRFLFSLTSCLPAAPPGSQPGSAFNPQGYFGEYEKTLPG